MFLFSCKQILCEILLAVVLSCFFFFFFRKAAVNLVNDSKLHAFARRDILRCSRSDLHVHTWCVGNPCELHCFPCSCQPLWLQAVLPCVPEVETWSSPLLWEFMCPPLILREIPTTARQMEAADLDCTLYAKSSKCAFRSPQIHREIRLHHHQCMESQEDSQETRGWVLRLCPPSVQRYQPP